MAYSDVSTNAAAYAQTLSNFVARLVTGVSTLLQDPRNTSKGVPHSSVRLTKPFAKAKVASKQKIVIASVC